MAGMAAIAAGDGQDEEHVLGLSDDDAFDEEDDDAGEKRIVEPPGGWPHETDEGVLREKADGLARTERAKAHIQAQETVLRNIHSKLAEIDDTDQPDVAVGQGMPPGSRPGSNWGSASHLGSSSVSSPEQQRNALVVSDKLVQRQERFDEFHRRRRSELERNRLSRERVASELSQMDSRCILRQRDIMERQRRRAFIANQKRSEQQKAKRELEREKDQITDEYYARQRAASPPKEAPPKSRASSSAKREGSAGTTSATSEDIFRSTFQSHKKYVGTMESWQEFVKENEKRTEAYWKKMLLGNTKFRDELIGVAGGGGRKTTGASTSVSGGSSRKSFKVGGGGLPIVSSIPSGISDEVKARHLLSLSDLAGTSTTIPSTTMSPLNSSNWESRMAKCYEHMDFLDKQGQEKLERKRTELLEHRDRIAAHNRALSDSAIKRGEIWKERNDSAVERRKLLEIKSDEEMVRKRQEFERKRKEVAEQELELLKEKAAHKDLQISDVKANCLQRLESREVSSKSRWAEKDQMVSEMYTQKLSEYESRLDDGKFEEEVAAVLERKNNFNLEVVAKAKKEIAQKALRHLKVVQKMSVPALERERTIKKERTASGVLSPSKSASGGLYSALSSSEMASTVSLPALAATGGGQSDVTSPEEQEALEQAAAGVDPAVALAKSAGKKELDLGDENTFLNELEGRSQAWLQDLRRRKRNNIGGPY